MNVFLTGATGYIGSSVLSALVSAGHTVTALVRDEAKARGAGATLVVGSIDDRELVRRLAAGADAVIATASPGDATSETVETAFAEAVLEGLRPGATFVRTGGIWVHGSGAAITEDTPRDAPGLVAWREELDTRALAAEGVRSVLIEPGIVYGRGTGIIGVVVSSARDGSLVGPGTQHWTTVHVDDLAELYVAALTQGGGGVYLGVSGHNPTVRELGEAVNSQAMPEEPAALVARLGAFGAALLLDQQATGEKARRELGWKPSRPSVLEEIASGGYDPA
ncbi:NAD-dependent epimerase/dehydratase family protein [Actinoplanes sp. CA-142083]|uniref:NAD-dependent epimerase/dehydratase family protein n=1 Tax=Actinoplanes sp. CA-142083 TaxID=3239903 RepID=UPI003D8D7715